VAIANSSRPQRQNSRSCDDRAMWSGGAQSCQVTVYAPYWVANSSVCFLKIWDRPEDSQVLGLPDVLDYSTMLAPRGIYGESS
jgi:hypothetical protein